MAASKRMTIAMMVLMGTFTVALFQNCGAGGMGPVEPTAGTGTLGAVGAVSSTSSYIEMKAMNEEINTLNAQNLACVTDDDCAPVAIGAKACGGPRRYIVASGRNPSLSRINELARLLSEEEARINNVTNAISTCSMVLPPQPSCVQNVCTTK